MRSHGPRRRPLKVLVAALVRPPSKCWRGSRDRPLTMCSPETCSRRCARVAGTYRRAAPRSGRGCRSVMVFTLGSLESLTAQGFSKSGRSPSRNKVLSPGIPSRGRPAFRIEERPGGRGPPRVGGQFMWGRANLGPLSLSPGETMLDWLHDFDLSTIEPSEMRAAFPLAVAGVIVWALWLYRCILSATGQADRQRLHDHDLGGRAVVPRGPRHPDALPARAGGRRTRPRSSSCSTSPTPRRYARHRGARTTRRSAGPVQARGQALRARRRDPDGDLGAAGPRPTPTPSGSRAC